MVPPTHEVHCAIIGLAQQEPFSESVMQLTAIVRKGEKQYVALCPEVDVVSQGTTVEEALANLKEAVELYVEEMGLPEGVGEDGVFVTHFGVKDAKAPSSVGA